jgi:hypothetical protein
MKTLIKTCLLSAMLILPVNAYAQSDVPAESASAMNCPMTAQTADVQKNMNAMMTDMGAMMNSTRDPSMKAHMQKMHEQMSAMMVNMRKMGGGMMGGAMPPGGKDTDSASSTTPPSAPEDHEAHHPNQ